jgi:hypothetical protein
LTSITVHSKSSSIGGFINEIDYHTSRIKEDLKIDEEIFDRDTLCNP